MGSQRLDVRRLELSGQAPERHGANATHVRRALLGAHAGVEDLGAGSAAVVVHEDHQGVLRDAEGLELGQDLAEVLVDIVEHAKEMLGVLAQSFAFVKGRILRPGVVGSVRRVGGHPSQEGTLGCSLAFDPLGGLREELIGTVAGRLHEFAVMQDRRSVVGILGHVTAAPRVALADTAGSMDEDFVEAPLVRLILRLVAEVPLSEDPGPIARLLELLGQGRGAKGQSLALEDGVRDAVLEFMSTSQQSAPRRGTGRGDLEIREADALRVQLVEVRGLEHGVTVRADIAVPLVIREDEQDVGSLGGERRQGTEQQSGEQSHRGERTMGPSPWNATLQPGLLVSLNER